ncbi:MAG: hypothetical protein CMM25_07205 [Rhodospirillaceae bacterium]|nr:hypothetical protein [Rhodospirillaceae bacterium]
MDDSLIENDTLKITESLTATVLEQVDGAEIQEATEAECVDGARINNGDVVSQNDSGCSNIRFFLLGCCLGAIFGINCTPY